jgi:hypothetical protein
MKTVTLPSGAELNIETLPPFADSEALFKAVMKDILLIIPPEQQIGPSVVKEFICRGLISDDIRRALWKCMDRVTYNGLKIDKDTFEPEEARQDYLEVCWQVAERNVSPFLKGLYARLSMPLSAQAPQQ